MLGSTGMTPLEIGEPVAKVDTNYSESMEHVNSHSHRYSMMGMKEY